MAEPIKTKTCRVCKQTKPLTEFYKSRVSRDGYINSCKDCRNAQIRRYQKTEKYKTYIKCFQRSEKSKAYQKHYKEQYSKSENGKAAQKRYNQSKKGRVRHVRHTKQAVNRHPECYKARMAVRQAVVKGKLLKVDSLRCSCGDIAKHYHHHKGYEQEHWLDVVPVCVKCHTSKTHHKAKM